MIKNYNYSCRYYSGKGLGSNEICYLADIVNIADYSPFGVQLDGRTVSSFMVDTEADCIVDTTYVLDTLTESYLHFDGVDDFADGAFNYSENFSPGAKKVFQTLNVLRGGGNILTQVKNVKNGEKIIDIFDSGGNAIGSIGIIDNVLQLDGNDSLLKMLEDTMKDSEYEEYK